MQPAIMSVLVLLSQEFCVRAELTSDYYWREYSGILPKDALQGGSDRNGNPAYIGQVRVNTCLLPGTIYKGSKTARVSLGDREYFVDKFVKILCTQNPDWYQWIPINIDKMHLLTNCHVVLGGHQQDMLLNIGRVNHEGETIIGKLIPQNNPNKGLWIPINTSQVNYSTFEVLTFNCDPDRYQKNLNLTLLN